MNIIFVRLFSSILLFEYSDTLLMSDFLKKMISSGISRPAIKNSSLHKSSLTFMFSWNSYSKSTSTADLDHTVICRIWLQC